MNISRKIRSKEKVFVEEKKLEVNYIIDKKLFSILTKVIYEKSNEGEIQTIHYDVKGKHFNVTSEPSANTEYSIVNLQRALPSNVKLACCQSCRNGNFCPYGDDDNGIFCLKDIIINSKNDAIEFFTENPDLAKTRSRKLLHFCNDYEPICHSKYYTYNDWDWNY